MVTAIMLDIPSFQSVVFLVTLWLANGFYGSFSENDWGTIDFVYSIRASPMNNSSNGLTKSTMDNG